MKIFKGSPTLAEFKASPERSRYNHISLPEAAHRVLCAVDANGKCDWRGVERIGVIAGIANVSLHVTNDKGERTGVSIDGIEALNELRRSITRALVLARQFEAHRRNIAAAE